MKPEFIEGDLLRQQVDVIINPWNRNIFPWWLLLPQGVSGAIKKEGGTSVFRELSTMGPIELGGARLTGPGSLPFQAIIHVSGINMFWCATRTSIYQSVKNAMALVQTNNFASAAFPLIGSGSGNRGKEFSRKIMVEAFDSIESNARVLLVQFKKN